MQIIHYKHAAEKFYAAAKVKCHASIDMPWNYAMFAISSHFCCSHKEMHNLCTELKRRAAFYAGRDFQYW